MLYKALVILFIWASPILVYLAYPDTIYVILVSLVIYITSFLLIIIKFSKRFNLGVLEKTFFFIFIVMMVGVFYGLRIAFDNSEKGKFFADYSIIDFIFPISVISSACIQATYLILTSNFSFFDKLKFK
jgi:hypothetical protein